jgi:hypothetical protein
VYDLILRGGEKGANFLLKSLFVSPKLEDLEGR